MEERINTAKGALEDSVHCENSHLFCLRGQVWPEVVLPMIVKELEHYWRAIALRGRSLYEAAR